MHVVERKRVIPAQTFIEKIWVASDGNEFTAEDACIKHEKWLQARSVPVFTSRIENVRDFYNDYVNTLFFIQSQDDYDFVLNLKSVKTLAAESDLFDDYGPGWYMHHWEDDGSIYGVDYINNLAKYVSHIDKDFKQWRRDISERIHESLCKADTFDGDPK